MARPPHRPIVGGVEPRNRLPSGAASSLSLTPHWTQASWRLRRRSDESVFDASSCLAHWEEVRAPARCLPGGCPGAARGLPRWAFRSSPGVDARMGRAQPVRTIREPSLQPEDCPALSLPGVKPCSDLEQMYSNISTCQLYPRLQGSGSCAPLLSTFGLDYFSLSRPIRASVAFHAIPTRWRFRCSTAKCGVTHTLRRCLPP